MNIIKKARKEKGLTRREVAEYLDLPLLVYIYYELHATEMHKWLCDDLCQYLNISYRDIL